MFRFALTGFHPRPGCWLVQFNSQSVFTKWFVLKGNTESNIEPTIWKSIDKWKDKWSQNFCAIFLAHHFVWQIEAVRSWLIQIAKGTFLTIPYSMQILIDAKWSTLISDANGLTLGQNRFLCSWYLPTQEKLIKCSIFRSFWEKTNLPNFERPLRNKAIYFDHS